MQGVEYCEGCGTPKAFQRAFCITCGRKFPRSAGPQATPALTVPEGAPTNVEPPSGPYGAGLLSAGKPPRRWGRVAVAAAVALALVAGAGALVLLPRDGGGGTAFALQFSEGQRSRYRMVMAVDATVSSSELGTNQPLQMTVDQTLGLKVLSVDARGTATVEVSLEGATVSTGGQTRTLPGGAAVRMQIARDGRVLSGGGLSFAGSGGSGLALPGMDQLTPLLPDHPVEPGDSWTKDFEVPFPFGKGAIRYTTTNRFLQLEQVGGTRTAVIASDLVLPLDLTVNLREALEGLGGGSAGLPRGTDPRIVFGGAIRAHQTNWFDPATGQPVRSLGSGKMDLEMRFQGFPRSAGPFEGKIRLAGTFKLHLERLA